MADGGGIEGVEVEVEIREGGGDSFVEVGMVIGYREEVKGSVFRACGVLENGEDGGDGSAEVGG